MKLLIVLFLFSKGIVNRNEEADEYPENRIGGRREFKWSGFSRFVRCWLMLDDAAGVSK